MRKYWLALSDRFNALQDRERWIIFILLTSLLVTFLYLGLIEPALTRRTLLQQQITTNTTALQAMRVQEQLLTTQSLANPEEARQQTIRQLQDQNQAVRAELAELQQHLAAPDKMPRLLQDLLGRDSGLELVSLKTLPPQDLMATDKKDGEPASGVASAVIASVAGATQAAASDPQAAVARPPHRGVYRHGMEVVVRGSYADLTAYLQKIEKLPWRLYWGDLRYQVDKYPLAQMSFTVYTISLDKAWLSL